ncbi:MAG: hypothetical protein G01um10145_714 [Microgenomates group bacterium Gr01-1014_5]|nr:MAG: hypothetical protein G01um10145_714 [Microgenomates group bacterium Gr01-1014_5]
MKLPRPDGRGIFSPRFVGSGIPPKRIRLRSDLRANTLVCFAKGDNSCRIQIMGLESRDANPLWLRRSHGPRVPGHQQKSNRLSGDMIRMLEERTTLIQKEILSPTPLSEVQPQIKESHSEG